ncbi:hypothetical protein HII31_00213 [Pseudocercospora fuligena]|uniref:Uncharacterized protein n=1 Tax=Pseudocercospora fuligena TaxID=685502 RepID=A0A8H6RVZ3_9PEZI|nr:hypothetical protein HII31_00213 [Pseudocercospora fuligena]
MVSTEQRRKKCGHFVIRREYCEEALARQPVAYCRSAHTPIFTDVDESDGVCPDRNKTGDRNPTADLVKHPPMPGQSSFSAWSGITTTSGEGNNWYRRQNQGQT